MKTATIERFHVWGTPRASLRLMYRGEDLTPRESPTLPRHPQMIPDDAAGIERLRNVARARGFTHIRFAGWTPACMPKGGAL